MLFINWTVLSPNWRKLQWNFLRFVSKTGFNDYEEERKRYNCEAPEHFNFSSDVIDKWANKETAKIRNNIIPAFWFIGTNGREIKWSFEELASQSKKVANVLKNYCDLGYNDRAIVILPKIPEWWLINIACIRNSTILSPGTTQLRVKDIGLRFEAFKPKVIIADTERAQLVDQIVEKFPCIKSKLLINSNKERNGWVLFNDVLKQVSDKHDCVKTSSHDPMMVFFTSGTTGNPKLTVHSHSSYGLGHFATGKYWLDVSSDDIMWNLSDTGWAKTAYSSLFAPWSQGCGVFIDGAPKFEAIRVFKILERYPISVICLPPTAYRMAVLENLKKFKFKALRHCVSAGEPLNAEIIEKWKNETGLYIYEGYGQTEMTASIANYRCIKLKPGSMGKAIPGYNVRIIDYDGQEVPVGVEGNIAIQVKPRRPVGLFSGYLDDPEKTASCFIGNFYSTGDRGYIDEDGYVWFVGRDDDVILSAGYRIGPFEVESALIEHPAVVESAVVSSPDSVRGEVVKAFVILAQEYLNNDKDALIKDIQEHVKLNTAPYKYPRKVEFVTELPKTISGKIRRIELRQKEWGKL